MTIERIGITGANGHVGRELLKYPKTFSLVADVTRPEEVEMAIKNGKPDLVVHLASVSDVDVCEDPRNKEWVLDVNVRGTYNVAEACMEHNIGMVLLSTSQVFSGKNWLLYKESDKPNPVNFYGTSKMGAEAIQTIHPHMKIVRTSYLFDYARLEKQIDILRKGNYFDYPTFINRSFMYLPHFVSSLYHYTQKFDKMPKILHIAGTESISWYDFMCRISQHYGIDSEQVMPRDKEIMNVAPRPYQAGLNVKLSRKLGLHQYSYLDGIKEMAGV